MVTAATALPSNASTSTTPLSFGLRLVIPAGLKPSEILTRISLARRGEWETLRGMMRTAPRHTADTPRATPRRVSRARHYMSIGNSRKALQVLAASAGDPIDHREEVDKLFPLEPDNQQGGHRSIPLRQRVPRDTAGVEADLNPYLNDKPLRIVVHTLIGRMSPESQPSPSGLRPEHLRMA